MDAASIAPASATPTAIQMPQHMQALQRANRVRLKRAALKRSIAQGEVDVAEVLRNGPWETESMSLAELLASQRSWGRTRVRKFLLGLSLNENKRLATLTSRQREMLLNELEAKGAASPSAGLLVEA
ncbi:MAG: hypothetical protein WD827_01705 [Solirubrobacterales bacterium]